MIVKEHTTIAERVAFWLVWNELAWQYGLLLVQQAA